jgi:hypothetical protein
MLTVSRLSIAVLICLIAGTAYSNPPSPTPLESKKQEQDKSGERKQQAGSDERGSHTVPLVIEVLPAKDADEITRQQHKHEQDKAFYDGLIAWSTIALAIVTTILAGFTGALWWATYKLARDARDAAKRQSIEMKESLRISDMAANAMEKVAQNIAITASQQMRAYLSVIIAGATYQERSKGLKFDARPLILNNGHTPAHKVGYKAKAKLLPIPLPDDFAFPLDEQVTGAAVLGPQQNFTMSAVVDDFCDDAEVDDIKKNTQGKALYMWGVVTYEDVFGETRKTRFCHQMMWIGDGKDEKVWGYYTGPHNNAT